MNVAIYIYDQAEVLDFSGPFEVFTTAARLAPKNGAPSVFLVSELGQTVTARGNYRVIPDYGFGDCPTVDLLIVPGGVHTGELDKPSVIKWIADIAVNTTITASVCTGAFLLAEAGVIKNNPATTHWEDIPALKKAYPSLTVHENIRWVDAGRVVTSGGISAGIDMSLHLIARLYGIDLAQKTAQQMEFAWRSSEGLQTADA
ncbi:DJ-1/PfpI family protein [Sedimenticola sp.]|uniref:DJ-1/PfpI family protein n=1 Tax=Sedimenticola sp. TaxID=1940285 RepID=UPI003D13731C